MRQGIKLLKQRRRATRPQDFKQELSGIDQEFIRNYFEQQLPAIGQQLVSNYFFNRNYQELTRNLSGIILNSNYQQLDSNFSAIIIYGHLRLKKIFLDNSWFIPDNSCLKIITVNNC